MLSWRPTLADSMNEEELARLLLALLNQLRPKARPLVAVEDLTALPAAELLDLSKALPDEIFLLYVQVLKHHRSGGLFAKLMGDHEEENRVRVDEFFKRYMGLVLEPAETVADFNPLLYYIPPEGFQDLGFIQSREAFFKRQTMAHINEFLDVHFDLPTPFHPEEQDKAWNFFFAELLKL